MRTIRARVEKSGGRPTFSKFLGTPTLRICRQFPPPPSPPSRGPRSPPLPSVPFRQKLRQIPPPPHTTSDIRENQDRGMRRLPIKRREPESPNRAKPDTDQIPSPVPATSSQPLAAWCPPARATIEGGETLFQSPPLDPTYVEEGDEWGRFGEETGGRRRCFRLITDKGSRRKIRRKPGRRRRGGMERPKGRRRVSRLLHQVAAGKGEADSLRAKEAMKEKFGPREQSDFSSLKEEEGRNGVFLGREGDIAKRKLSVPRLFLAFIVRKPFSEIENWGESSTNLYYRGGCCPICLYHLSSFLVNETYGTSNSLVNR